MTSTEAPAKRRIELTAVEPKEGDANPTKKIKPDDAKQEVTVKNDLLNFTLFPNPNGDSQEAKINEQLKSYISDYFSNLNKYKTTDYKRMEVLLVVIKQLKEKCSHFLKFQTFVLLLENHSNDIKEAQSAREIITAHDDLILELKRYSTPSENIEKPEMNEEKRLKLVRKYTKQIDDVRAQLKKYEVYELTGEEMENDSYFTLLDKLKYTLLKIWRKRENLNNHSTALIGQHVFKKFTYSKTGNAKVNLLVEEYFSSCMQKLRAREDRRIHRRASKFAPVTFDELNVIELRNFLDKGIKDSKIDYSVSEEELIKIFDDLVRERNRRRCTDVMSDFNSLEQERELYPNSFPNFKDEDLKKETEKNSEIGYTAFRKVLDDFVEKDKELNKQYVDPEYLGQDDVGENDMDLIDVEDEEEEEETEEVDENDGEQSEA